MVEKTVIIKEYQLGKILGRGAFGVVYLALNQKSNQEVALKCIDNTLLTDKFLSDSLKKEIFIMQ